MIQLKATVVCTVDNCGETADCTCSIEARIESGGCVEITLIPDLPTGWTDRHYGQYCPRCSENNNR